MDGTEWIRFDENRGYGSQWVATLSSSLHWENNLVR